MSKPYCVIYNLECSDDTKMNTAFTGILNGIGNLVSRWENATNKSMHCKGYDNIHGPGKHVVGGMQRMSDVNEKNVFINIIRGIGNPPFITGKVTSHVCSHFSWKCKACNHTWETMEAPDICPGCGSPAEIIVDDKIEKIIVTDVKKCVIDEEYDL